MARWQQQGLIDASVEGVWELLADPSRYPEWAGDAIETTGAPTQVVKGSTYEQTGPGPFGSTNTTTFEVVELDDMREIKLRCQTSGYYSHWKLTEARGETFADLEIGVEPIGVMGQVARFSMSKSQLRRLADASLDGLRRLSAE